MLTDHELETLVQVGSVLKSGHYTTTVRKITGNYAGRQIVLCDPWTPKFEVRTNPDGLIELDMDTIKSNFSASSITPPLAELKDLNLQLSLISLEAQNGLPDA